MKALTVFLKKVITAFLPFILIMVLNLQYCFLFILVVLASCQPVASPPKAALAEIANTHFAELPVMKELLPLMSSQEWFEQKGFDIDKFKREMGEGQQPILEPPPPPADTVLYSDAFFREMVEQEFLSDKEAESFKHQLLNTHRPVEWEVGDGLNVEVISKAELHPKNKEGQLSFPPHRRFSAPLLSADGRKVLARVEEYLSPDAGYGYTCLFEKREGRWTEIFRKMNWIN